MLIVGLIDQYNTKQYTILNVQQSVNYRDSVKYINNNLHAYKNIFSQQKQKTTVTVKVTPEANNLGTNTKYFKKIKLDNHTSNKKHK